MSRREMTLLEAQQAEHRAILWRAIGGTGPAPEPPFPGPSAKLVVADLDHTSLVCPACRARYHGLDCENTGCACRCRAMLGLAGPFEHGDPTAPGVIDMMEGVG